MQNVPSFLIWKLSWHFLGEWKSYWHGFYPNMSEKRLRKVSTWNEFEDWNECRFNLSRLLIITQSGSTEENRKNNSTLKKHHFKGFLNEEKVWHSEEVTVTWYNIKMTHMVTFQKPRTPLVLIGATAALQSLFRFEVSWPRDWMTACNDAGTAWRPLRTAEAAEEAVSALEDRWSVIWISDLKHHKIIFN